MVHARMYLAYKVNLGLPSLWGLSRRGNPTPWQSVAERRTRAATLLLLLLRTTIVYHILHTCDMQYARPIRVSTAGGPISINGLIITYLPLLIASPLWPLSLARSLTPRNESLGGNLLLRWSDFFLLLFFQYSLFSWGSRSRNVKLRKTLCCAVGMIVIIKRGVALFYLSSDKRERELIKN